MITSKLLKTFVFYIQNSSERHHEYTARLESLIRSNGGKVAQNYNDPSITTILVGTELERKTKIDIPSRYFGRPLPEKPNMPELVIRFGKVLDDRGALIEGSKKAVLPKRWLEECLKAKRMLAVYPYIISGRKVEDGHRRYEHDDRRSPPSPRKKPKSSRARSRHRSRDRSASPATSRRMREEPTSPSSSRRRPRQRTISSADHKDREPKVRLRSPSPSPFGWFPEASSHYNQIPPPPSPPPPSPPPPSPPPLPPAFRPGASQSTTLPIPHSLRLDDIVKYLRTTGSSIVNGTGPSTGESSGSGKDQIWVEKKTHGPFNPPIGPRAERGMTTPDPPPAQHGDDTYRFPLTPDPPHKDDSAGERHPTLDFQPETGETIAISDGKSIITTIAPATKPIDQGEPVKVEVMCVPVIHSSRIASPRGEELERRTRLASILTPPVVAIASNTTSQPVSAVPPAIETSIFPMMYGLRIPFFVYAEPITLSRLKLLIERLAGGKVVELYAARYIILDIAPESNRTPAGEGEEQIAVHLDEHQETTVAVSHIWIDECCNQGAMIDPTEYRITFDAAGMKRWDEQGMEASQITDDGDSDLDMDDQPVTPFDHLDEQAEFEASYRADDNDPDSGPSSMRANSSNNSLSRKVVANGKLKARNYRNLSQVDPEDEEDYRWLKEQLAGWLRVRKPKTRTAFLESLDHSHRGRILWVGFFERYRPVFQRDLPELLELKGLRNLIH